ncbi:glycosyltransferase family 2 protein [Paracoccus nototheniae]
MIRDAFRRFKQRRRQARAMADIAARPTGPGRAHGLGSELIVSLTSYPARFGTLLPTLQALTLQSVQPDRVILWLDDGDALHLPPDIRSMAGLEIRTCPAWRSYKKIVQTLIAHPGAFVVTADDDLYYAFDWLEGLTDAAGAGARIACHRAHQVVLHNDRPAPYEQWRHNLDAPDAGPLVFPTGVSGVIYAPGVFHPDVTRDDLFMRLAPGADDLWLYWMGRMAGSAPVKIGGRNRILEWQGSQETSLRAVNRPAQGMGGNDRAIAALMDHYGWPRWPG